MNQLKANNPGDKDRSNVTPHTIINAVLVAVRR